MKAVLLSIMSVLLLAALLIGGCGGGGSGTVVEGNTEQRALEIPAASALHGIILIDISVDWVERTRTGSVYDGRAYWYVGCTDIQYFENEIGAGGDDAFLAKYDASGLHRIWVRLLGGTGNDTAYGVTSDGDNVIYIAGATDSPVLNGQTTDGGNDVFLARFDADGNRIWTRLLGGSGDDAPRYVAIDHAGNVFVTGSTTSPELDSQTNAGASAIFLAKYDAHGNRIWTRLLGGTGDDILKDVKIDGSGNIYVTGSTTSPILDNQVGSGGRDAFLAKYDIDGNRVWTRLFGGSGEDGAHAFVVDNSGDVYIGGYSFSCRIDNWLNFASTAIDNVSADAFLAKYDAAGDLVWSRLLGSDFNDIGLGLELESTGTIALTGLRGCNSLDLAGNYTPSLGEVSFRASFTPDGNLLDISSWESY